MPFRRRLPLVLVTVIGVAVASVGVSAQTLDELRDEQDRVQGDADALGGDIDVLSLDAEDAEAELLRREERAAQGEAIARLAGIAADSAAAVAARSTGSADLAAAQVVDLRDRAAQLAIERYLGNPERQGLEATLAGDLFAWPMIESVLGFAARRDAVDAGVVEAAEGILSDREEAAGLATTEAQRLREVALRLSASAEQARAEYRDFVDQLNFRLDTLLAEASALEELDAELAARIRAREVALSRLLPPRPAAGSVNVGDPVGFDETVVVRGFRVHVSIQEQTAGLIDAATAAGFDLGGGGWRDGASQISLRRAHCGPTDYDIWEKPAGQCRPPTARPSRSMHERGLALDLTVDGRLLTSRLHPAYEWLLLNADAYGFFNLPSEPWHWSVNGR